MIIDKERSSKFKQIINYNFKSKLIKRIALGTIVISVPFFVNINNTENNNIVNEDDNINTNTQSNSVVFSDLNTRQYLIKVEKNDGNISKVYEEKKLVALSFDDGPSKYTEELLKILKDNDVTATFYVLGSNIENKEEVIQNIIDNGHEIGNHGYGHDNPDNLTSKEILKDIEKTNELINNITGKNPTSYRPPYGNSNNVSNNKLPIVLWTKDSRDWDKKVSDEDVINNIINDLDDGHIILMHDTYNRSIEIIERVIPLIKEMGYDIVSVKEMFELKEIPFEEGNIYFQTENKKIKY